jgi:hypothetical protein
MKVFSFSIFILILITRELIDNWPFFFFCKGTGFFMHRLGVSNILDYPVSV